MEVVEGGGGGLQTEGEHERPVEHDHRDRVVRRERSVRLPGDPPMANGDGGVAVPGTGCVEVGEDDRGVGRLVGRERPNDRASEVLPRLDRVRTEGVGAVGVGGEVPHPVVRCGDEPDPFLRPAVRRRQIGEPDRRCRHRHERPPARRAGIDRRERGDPGARLTGARIPPIGRHWVAGGYGRLRGCRRCERGDAQHDGHDRRGHA